MSKLQDDEQRMHRANTTRRALEGLGAGTVAGGLSAAALHAAGIKASPAPSVNTQTNSITNAMIRLSTRRLEKRMGCGTDGMALWFQSASPAWRKLAFSSSFWAPPVCPRPRSLGGRN